MAPGDDPCALSPSAVVTYRNDAMGRRIERTDAVGKVTRWMYRDALRPLAQFDADGHLEQLYLYLSAPHSPDGMITYNASGTATGYLVFVRDLRGSIRQVIDGSTGTVVQELDYDPFGKVLTDTHPGFQPFGFAGGLYDPDTGLTRFGAREYDADTGRWLSKDPIGFSGGDTNLYGYVLQDPVNGVDPEGLLGFYVFSGAGVHAGVTLQTGVEALGIWGLDSHEGLYSEAFGAGTGRYKNSIFEAELAVGGTEAVSWSGVGRGMWNGAEFGEAVLENSSEGFLGTCEVAFKPLTGPFSGGAFVGSYGDFGVYASADVGLFGGKGFEGFGVTLGKFHRAAWGRVATDWW